MTETTRQTRTFFQVCRFSKHSRFVTSRKVEHRILSKFHLRNSPFINAAKGPTVWAALARKMGPQALRMNLDTLLRHDVFNEPMGASSYFHR